MDADKARFPVAPGPVGIDEVGRGALAGEIVVAGYRFDTIPSDDLVAALDDSKKLSATRRAALVPRLVEIGTFVIAQVDVETIDSGRLGPGLEEAMAFVARALRRDPRDPVLVDGKVAPRGLENAHALVKADATEPVVAAAAIIAKEHRDRLFREVLENAHPGYGFADHVGYGTKAHFSAIERLGPVPGLHRNLFLRKYTERRAREAVDA